MISTSSSLYCHHCNKVYDKKESGMYCPDCNCHTFKKTRNIYDKPFFKGIPGFIFVCLYFFLVYIVHRETDELLTELFEASAFVRVINLVIVTPGLIALTFVLPAKLTSKTEIVSVSRDGSSQFSSM